MAAKRSSRVYVDEAILENKSHQQLGDSRHWPQSDEESNIGFASRPDAPSVPLSPTNYTLEKEVCPSLPNSDKWLVTASQRPTKTSAVPTHFPVPSPEGRPVNFGVVIPGFYRSSYPKVNDFPFLQNLELKTVVTLVKKDEIDHEFESFCTTNGVRQITFNMKGTKKEAIPISTMSSILSLVLDQRNYPLLLHCNHGKHRTGCVVAAVRKTSGWNLDMAIDEYKTFAEPKIRECDVDYIKSFRLLPSQSILPRVIHEHSMRITPMQMRSFFRTLLFSSVVITLWMVSGSRMLATRG